MCNLSTPIGVPYEQPPKINALGASRGFE